MCCEGEEERRCCEGEEKRVRVRRKGSDARGGGKGVL